MMVETERTLSVSDAMLLAKGALEHVRVRVIGEVSECTIKPGYKAIYFSLKDGGAVMPCLMWRDAYEGCGAELRDGQLVEVGGFFTAYAPKGRLQFQVRSMVLAGEGALRLKVAALARVLEAEGLMRPDRKRVLPLFPDRIGLVTSPRGKAVHDVIRTLGRRYPIAELVIAGVQVEGPSAEHEIVRGLELVGPQVDVVILGRGGGSYEDLMPFNTECVARAVASCPVPVVTGIGHEPDTSIADMVADLRASTPTAAAEAVVPSRDDLDRRLSTEQRLLGRALSHVVKDRTHRLGLLMDRPVFRDTACLLAQRMQSLDLVAGALGRALPERLSRQTEATARASENLLRVGRRLFEARSDRVLRDEERVRVLGPALISEVERDLGATAARLEDLSPVAILGRGYAVCYEEDGAIVVRSAESVSPGDKVSVRLARGRLGCVVETTRTEE
jgi:exodeoxyribonuclease VII large subunit